MWNLELDVASFEVERLFWQKSPINDTAQRYPHHYPEKLRGGIEVLDRIKLVTYFITAGSVGRELEAAIGLFWWAV